MRKIIVGGALALLVLAQAASAQTGTKLTIEGTSTLRSWTCEATGYTLTPEPARGFEAGVLKGEKALKRVTLTVPVASIECGNGTMNEHLRKALREKDHPQITYTLAAYELAEAEGGVAVASDGLLTIAGAERPIAMDVAVTADGAGGVRIRGEQEIRMTDFGVKPPKLMLGTLKVGDEVTIAFDMPLAPYPVAIAAQDRNDN